jgi:hypothetical protein
MSRLDHLGPCETTVSKNNPSGSKSGSPLVLLFSHERGVLDFPLSLESSYLPFETFSSSLPVVSIDMDPSIFCCYCLLIH